MMENTWSILFASFTLRDKAHFKKYITRHIRALKKLPGLLMGETRTNCSSFTCLQAKNIFWNMQIGSITPHSEAQELEQTWPPWLPWPTALLTTAHLPGGLLPGYSSRPSLQKAYGCPRSLEGGGGHGNWVDKCERACACVCVCVHTRLLIPRNRFTSLK